MLKLLHHPMSGSSRFIRLILQEYKLEAQLIVENTWEKRHDFLLLNPAETLPVLIIPTEQAICGAVTIAEYIDETCGTFKRERRLFSDDPLVRAETRRLLHWFLTKFDEEVAYPLVYERIFKRIMPAALGISSPNSTILRKARQNLTPHMKYLEWLIYNRDWFAGDSFGYADLAAASEISILDYTGEIDWSQYPIIKDWYLRIKSRPSFRSILQDRITGLSPVAHYADLDF